GDRRRLRNNAEEIGAALNEAEGAVAAVADVVGSACGGGPAAKPKKGGSEDADAALTSSDRATDVTLPELHALIDQPQLGALHGPRCAAVLWADEVLQRTDLRPELRALRLVFAHDRCAHPGAASGLSACSKFRLGDAAALLPCP